MRKFEIVEGDMDRVISERTITGRMTPKRFKILHRYARVNSPNSSELRCHHEHDCCGCVCDRSMELSATHTGATLKLTICYNC